MHSTEGTREAGSRLDDIDARLRHIESIDVIRQLKQRYARLCDAGYPPDDLADLFTADGVCDWGPEFAMLRGRDEIREYFADCAAQFPWTLHYIVNTELSVSADGTEARGDWYLFKPCTVANSDGHEQAVWMAGIYHDEFRKVDAHWKIKRLQAEMSFVTPYESGWLKERFMTSAKASERWQG